MTACGNSNAAAVNSAFWAIYMSCTVSNLAFRRHIYKEERFRTKLLAKEDKAVDFGDESLHHRKEFYMRKAYKSCNITSPYKSVTFKTRKER